MMKLQPGIISAQYYVSWIETPWHVPLPWHITGIFRPLPVIKASERGSGCLIHAERGYMQWRPRPRKVQVQVQVQVQVW